MLFLVVLVGSAVLLSAADKPSDPPTGPLSPKEELASFRVLKGFKVELVAAEPEVVDPVALAFDEDGRMYVAEMRGYPNGGLGTGNISTGKIKLLEDSDGDGYYERSVTFAENLRFPTSMMPYRGGLLAAVAPDLLYFEKTAKGHDKKVLYTGFDLDNIQQLLNSLQWGLDNWVYANAGGKGGTITTGDGTGAGVALRGRGIRFQPARPGSLEPTSGGGQFGLAADDWQHWFTATNSQHLRQIVLPDHYLRRNPALAVPAVTIDIPDHGAACQVHRISPFEGWRVERTTRRKDGTDSKRFSPTELVPGGFITSACSPVVYNGGLFPEQYYGQSFVCEPANNLIHRDLLIDQGSHFTAKRADEGCEFLASTDNWFRPVNLTIGPDGAIYVCDFYREAIETPLSLPDDIKKKLNLESRGRGRIWRIVPESFARDAKNPPHKPALGKASAGELVQQLDSPNSWRRLTAQRLLIERQDQAAVAPLQKLAREGKLATGQGKVHALWTLHGLKALDDELIETNLKVANPHVVEQALRLAEERLSASAPLRQAVVKLTETANARVRFQLAFTLGAADAPELTAALAKLARRDAGQSWFQLALLSSAKGKAPDLLATLGKDREFVKNLTTEQRQLVTRLGTLIGASNNDTELAQALALLAGDEVSPVWQLAVLDGLGQGLQIAQRPLRQLWEEPSPALKDAVIKARPFFERAAKTARDEKQPLPERLAAVRLLGVGPFAIGGDVLPGLLAPQHLPEVQLAAVRALSAQDSPKIAELLLASWNSYPPDLRREAAEALLARPERVRKLLEAVEKKQVLPGQIEAARVDLLRKHPDAEIKKRVAQLFAARTTGDRQKIVDDYRAALELPTDAMRGKAVFKKNCSVCHRLENEGSEVGADLLAALKTKTPEGLVLDILDPSREVDPRYLNYVVTTKNGRFLTGILAVNAPASITLRRAEKAEDTILRGEIDEIQATVKSLMPDELEKQLSKQDLADVIAYLLGVAGRK
jgi:putative membrane-bound dehydrogenase-like protein